MQNYFVAAGLVDREDDAYPGKVFGSGETSLTGEGPQHAGGCGDEAYGGKKLGHDDDTSLHL